MSKMGRPTLRTPDVVAAILEGLSNGQTLTSLCGCEGMPSPSTFRSWARDDEQLSADFARAREAGFDAIAEEALNIADTPMEGVSEKYEEVSIDNPDEPGGPKVKEFQLTERKVEDMLGHRKLQIETRLKLLAKWDPRRYGEKVEVNGTMTLEQLVAGAGRAAAKKAEGADE